VFSATLLVADNILADAAAERAVAVALLAVDAVVGQSVAAADAAADRAVAAASFAAVTCCFSIE